MGGPEGLTYKKKVLLYLREFDSLGERDVYPKEITQKGIADAVGIRRTHVSRVVRDLIDKGELKEKVGHVRGHSRKLKVYFLRAKGSERGQDLIDELKEVQVSVKKDGETFKCALTELNELLGNNSTLIEAIEILEESGEPLDLDKLGPMDYMKDLTGAPEVNQLYGRGEVLTRIDEWLRGSVPVAVLNGRRGYGSSSTARRFLDSVDDRHLLWIDVQKDDVEERLKGFYRAINEDAPVLIECIENTPALVVIDNYYQVEDELVDFLVDLLDNIGEGSSTKILVTTRKGLPVYERFYHREHLKEGKVVQIEVLPLNEEEVEMLFDKKLETSALRRIMLMTKGSPEIIKLLREGRVKEIEERSALVKEQISLLMFLKEKTE